MDLHLPNFRKETQCPICLGMRVKSLHMLSQGYIFLSSEHVKRIYRYWNIYLSVLLFCLDLSRYHTEDTDSYGVSPSVLQAMY